MIKLYKYNLIKPAIKFVGCFFLTSAISTSFAYERIVSTTGNASETIAALGLADKLVAVDTTSTLPKAVMDKKPKIGYRRRLSAEGILSMRPDLLILAPDAGPPAVIKQIKTTKTPSITISDKKSVEGVVADIKMIADKLGATEAAKLIIRQIKEDEKQINLVIDGYAHTPKIIFLMDGGAGKNRLMALGGQTAGDAMIKIVGGENVFAKTFKSVKPVSTESMISTDMDVIIVATHGSKEEIHNEMINAVKDYPNLALTKAAKNNCIFRIGTVESLGFGPSFSKAAKVIAKTVATCVEPKNK